jgi:RimJ/RimL family protein N-acetyltransferase
MSPPVRLGPIQEEHLERLLRMRWDPETTGEFQWFGFRMDDAARLRRRWSEDGLIGPEVSFLAVLLEDAACAGWVSWRPVGAFGNWEIGVALFPDYRGRGIGTEAQVQLTRYLFDTTAAERIQAATEADNRAEQRSLEKAGFRREGVLRAWGIRAGHWRDGVMYSRLRSDDA